MFACPRCHCSLERLVGKKGVSWRCPACEGRALTISLLRRMLERNYVNQLWLAARDTTVAAYDLTCPMCGNGMATVQRLTSKDNTFSSLEIDVCTHCECVWFDPHEMEFLLQNVSLQEERKPELSPKAREIIAMAKVEALREEAERENPAGGEPPVDGWEAILAVFGIPVEEKDSVLSDWPWVTWGTFLLITLVTAWGTWINPAALNEWGLIPNEAFRCGGLTLVLSFFLHSGLLHYFGNVAFLLVFGDDVEDFLGHFRFAMLLIGSSLAGNVIHVFFDPNASMPLVGASGGIAGIIAFYAFQFPKARLVYRLRYEGISTWLHFSAAMGFLGWVVLQGIGVWQEVTGISQVSALSHIGGAVFGILWWLTLRHLIKAEEKNRGER